MRSSSFVPTELLAVAVLMCLTLVLASPKLAAADYVTAEAALGHLIGHVNDSDCDCLDSSKIRPHLNSKKLQSSILKSLEKAKTGYYDVQFGDTLDGIIRDQIGNNPVHKNILRQAVVLANPKAFRRNNPHWLYANRKIKLPEAADIHRAVFKQSAIQDSLLDRINSKKHWIRYP